MYINSDNLLLYLYRFIDSELNASHGSLDCPAWVCAVGSMGHVDIVTEEGRGERKEETRKGRGDQKGKRRPEREEETRKGRGDQKGKRRPERKEARKEDRKRKRKEGNFDNFKCYCSEWPFSYSRLTKLQRNAR